jgi:hypothetical protein
MAQHINGAIQNGDNPVVTLAQASADTVYGSGNVMVVDSSYCCLVNITISGNGYIRTMYFDKDVSSVSFGNYLKSNAAYGSIEKIGSEYHMLFMDVSTGVSNRTIIAAKSNNLEGPYVNYQSIVYASGAPAGSIWDVACDMPLIVNDGKNIYGLFGGQGSNGRGGVGVTNREFLLLNYNTDTQIWSLDPKGPVIINPIDWPALDWYWGQDHVGAAPSTLIDNGNMWFTCAFNQGTSNYSATILKLKNYT